jgi:hypothetical protein
MPFSFREKYYVNPDKETVTCIVDTRLRDMHNRYLVGYDEVQTSRTAPGDEFNVAIGKRISSSRARNITAKACKQHIQAEIDRFNDWLARVNAVVDAQDAIHRKNELAVSDGSYKPYMATEKEISEANFQ